MSSFIAPCHKLDCEEAVHASKQVEMAGDDDNSDPGESAAPGVTADLLSTTEIALAVPTVDVSDQLSSPTARSVFTNSEDEKLPNTQTSPVAGTVLHSLLCDAPSESSLQYEMTRSKSALAPPSPSPIMLTAPERRFSTCPPNPSVVELKGSLIRRPSPLPTPAQSQSDLIGVDCLTEEEAESRMSAALDRLYRRCGEDLAAQKWKLVAVESWPNSLAMAIAALLMAVVALVLGLQGDAAAVCSVEATLLGCISVLHLLLHQYRAQLSRCDALARVYSLLHTFVEEQSQQQSVQELIDGLLVSSAAVTTVQVLRGVEGSKAWKTVMPSLLVEGDLIRLAAEEPAPAYVLSAELNLPSVELQMGSSWSDVENKLQSRLFFVKEFPTVLLVEHMINPERSDRAASYEQAEWMALMKAMQKTAAALVLLSVVLNLWILLQRDETDSWELLMVARQVYVLAVALPLAPQCVWVVANMGCSAYMLALFDSLLEEDRISPGMKFDDKTPPEVPTTEWWRQMKGLMGGHGSSLGNSWDYVHTLGSITAMCCVNKQGVIATPIPYLEKLLLPKDFFDHDSGKRSQVMLDVERNDTSTSRTVRFEDARLQKEHQISLRPIGLINLLVNRCRLHSYSLVEVPEAAFCNESCLHYLSNEIGFHEDVLAAWVKQAEFSIERPVIGEAAGHQHRGGELEVVVVESKRDEGALQLLMSGHPLIVLEHCTHYFDPDVGGKDSASTIRPLTADNRRSFIARYDEWAEVQGHSCNSFAYRPIVLEEDISVFTQAQNRKKGQQRRKIKHGRIATGWPPEELCSPTAGPRSDALVESKLHGAIFLGMSAMRVQAKQPAIDMVDDLRKAGIRFIHFCPDPMRRAIAFADKLGLDADWNCCISLRNPTPEDKNIKFAISVQSIRNESDGALAEGEKSNASESHASVAQQLAADLAVRAAVNSDEVLIRQQPLPQPSLSSPNEDPDSSCEQVHSYKVSLPPVGGGMDQQLFDKLQVGMQLGPCLIKQLVWDSNSPRIAANPNPAKLPVGVNAIRSHIEEVDNVPLLVNLFAEAGPEESEEMVRIMQENGECVLCIGSSFCPTNANIFAQADFAVYMEPSHPNISTDRRCEQVRRNPGLPNGPRPPTFVSPCHAQKVVLSGKLNTLSCGLGVSTNLGAQEKDEVNLCIWVSVICQARRLHTNLLQAAFFVCGANMSLALLAVVVTLCHLPSLITVVHVVWFSWLFIPAVTLALLATPQDEDVMKVISPKKQIGEDVLRPQWADASVTTRHLVIYYVCRFVPSVLLTVVMYAWCLKDSFKRSWWELVDDDNLFDDKMRNELYGVGLQKLQWARGVALWAFALYLCVISAGFVHRLNPIFCRFTGDDEPKLKRRFRAHPVWWLVVGVGLATQAALTSVVIVSVDNDDTATTFSWEVAVIGFAWPLFIVLIDSAVKRHDGKQFIADQKWLMLQFKTRLGQHSPVADFKA